MNAKQKNLVAKMIEKELAIGTKAAIARAEKMLAYTQNENDDGAFGRIVELSSHTEKSRKTRVSKQGEKDTSIKFSVNGKTRYIAAEVKTNGGRIEGLYSPNAPKFVIYSMNVCNSLATYNTSKKVFPTAVFLEMLETLNAIKSTNGTNPERAIQAVSKKLYTAVSDWSIEYNPNATYTADDFEGLTW